MKSQRIRLARRLIVLEIPAHLDLAVRRAMQREQMKTRFARVVKYALSAAAVLFVITAVTLLNVSPVFAKAAQGVPVLGDLCRIFTFRHDDVHDEIKGNQRDGPPDRKHREFGA